MLNDIKAVIFDLDGTLVDSMWMWKDIDIDYLDKHGITFPKKLQHNIEGQSFTETAQYFKKHFNLKDSVEDIKAEWNDMAIDKYKNEVDLKEGAMEYLKLLKRKNIKTGIATSNSRDLVDVLIDKLGIEKYFDIIRTSCEAKRGKPYPDVYELVANDLNVDPKNCLVFEDVIHGIMAGKSAGMKVCAVYDKYSEHQYSEKVRLADYYIETFNEILK
ncbi:MAG TPA: HAD family phosphatase [Clostridiales bacterium]|nr:HAD family phosphatase [Clostridiales bacterium]